MTVVKNDGLDKPRHAIMLSQHFACKQIASLYEAMNKGVLTVIQIRHKHEKKKNYRIEHRKNNVIMFVV